MTTNARKEANRRNQAAYKESMRKAGYQQVSIWIQPDRKHILVAFAFALREVKSFSKLKDQAWDSLVNWANE